jgi:hypothetical protein
MIPIFWGIWRRCCDKFQQVVIKLTPSRAPIETTRSHSQRAHVARHLRAWVEQLAECAQGELHRIARPVREWVEAVTQQTGAG